MVEIQLGSIDMIQSIAAKEMVKRVQNQPRSAERLEARHCCRARRDGPVRADHLVRKNDSTFQMAK